MSRSLAELLVKDRLISSAQFADAATAAQQGKPYLKTLLDKKVLAETKLLYYLSQKFGLPSINLAKFEVPPEVIRLVPPEFVRKHGFIPIQSAKGTLVIAIWDPTQMGFVEDLKFRTKLNVEAVLTSFSAFEVALSKYYAGVASVGAAIETFQRDAEKGGAKSTDGLELVQVHEIDSNVTDQDAPVITLVNGILSESIQRGASDIHVEPYEKRFRVRMRLDGVLQEILQIPVEMKRAVLARLKIMSRMDIAESRVPQDGRIKLKAGGREIDFRVNSMPTLYGEKVVLRLLSQGNLQLDLTKLGFESAQMGVFKKGISAANGMVLVTGPTGSGKTTTLYSALSELNKVSDNISTAEDPVEYNLEGVNQVQVNKDVGLTFAAVLRALLRQDPDIILVGEIRDFETAEVAVQAALTGHLVLSTLHTNDAPSTITRLMNMGLEPFLVVACLNTIVAQRLLRMLCNKCREPVQVPEARLKEVGYPSDWIGKTQIFKAKGCANCGGTGYRGRVAVYEVLDFNNTLKEMVLRGESAIELRKQAVRDGMKPLRLSALTKVAEGRTSLEEAVAMTMEE